MCVAKKIEQLMCCNAEQSLCCVLQFMTRACFKVAESVGVIGFTGRKKIGCVLQPVAGHVSYVLQPEAGTCASNAATRRKVVYRCV